MPMAIQTDGDNDKSGVQDAFCQTKAMAALKAHGVYRCAISIWWLNTLSSPTPGVPLARRRVIDLSEYYFGAEGRPQFHTDRMLEIAVGKGDIQTDTPSGLQLISPEEVLHATLAGCSRCIQCLGSFEFFFSGGVGISSPCLNYYFEFKWPFFWRGNFCFATSPPRTCKGHTDWEDVKAKWKAVLLCIPASFSEIARQDMWKEAYNRRQQVVQDHESLTRSAMQASVEIVNMKQLLEAAAPGKQFTPQTLSQELLAAGLQQVVGGSVKDDEGDKGGSLSAWTIRSALSVHKTVLSNSRCVEVIMELETRYGTRSPFHKMAVLNTLATKPASAKTRQFVLDGLNDWLLRGLIKVANVSVGVLAGDKHHVGLISLFECKQRVPSLNANRLLKLLN